MFVVPPLYKNQTALGAALRYLRTFGLGAAWGLTRRTLRAKGERRSIRRVCERHSVGCESVTDVNDSEFLARLREIGTELIVSVSCPQIFGKPLIELPPRGCLNIHGAWPDRGHAEFPCCGPTRLVDRAVDVTCTNRGLGHANNRGLLNYRRSLRRVPQPDTEVVEGSLEQLVEWTHHLSSVSQA